MCLHDCGGNARVFDATLDRLSGKHSPIAFDQPGHGRSGGLDSLGSIERMAAFSRALMDKLGLERPVVLGHGMGGAVALEIALAAPDALRALVLCATGARLPISELQLERTRRVTEGKQRRSLAPVGLTSAAPPELQRRAVMESLRTDPRALRGDLIACRDWDAASRLASLALPTLVISGDEDEGPAAGQAELLATGIPGAQQRVIAKAARQIPLEQPEALSEAVEGFLEGLAP